MSEWHYWPITYTTFWLEHKLWGLDPFGTHLVNVLLYMVNVLLLWHLLRRLTVPGAWAVAAVFAVHPMHVESVVWAIGRKDLLSGIFYMGAALCWMRAIDGLDDSPSPAACRRRILDPFRVPRPGLYLSALGLFAAAMLSKTVVVTLPAAFVVLLWWQNGRVTWTDACRVAPFFLVGLCIAVADLSYYTSGREITLDYGFLERVLIAAHALWFYAGKLVWPTELAVIYPLWDIDIGDPLAWGYLIAAVAVAALLWAGRHRLGRGPLAGAVFFAVMLSPVLCFVDFAYMALSFVADRYAYLAGIGLIAVLIGVAVHNAVRLPNPLRIGASCVLVAVLAVFGKLTWDQAGIYRDEFTFYNHIISLNPGAKSAHRNLARALLDAGRPAEALTASRIEVERFPGSPKAHDQHGVVLLALDRLEEAGESFQRALRLDPGHRSARQNMAETYTRQGRFVESLRWYQAALDIDPEFTRAHVGMGVALFQLGRDAQAVESLQQAVSLSRGALPINALRLLGDTLRKQRRYGEAIETYRGILGTDPRYAPAHAGIGYALVQLKRYDEAVESLVRAVSLQPDSADVTDRHVAMGRAFAALDRMKEAAEHFARALEIDPRNGAALDSLAVLRFRQQRFEEALGLYEALIETGEANAQIHLNMGATLYNLGRVEESRRSLDRARALDSSLGQITVKATSGTPPESQR